MGLGKHVGCLIEIVLVGAHRGELLVLLALS